MGSIEQRRATCIKDKNDSAQFATWANDRANDAQSYVDKSKQIKIDIGVFITEAAKMAPKIAPFAADAEKIDSEMRIAIQKAADTIVTETDNERTDLNNIVINAGKEFDKITAKAKIIRDSANKAPISVNSLKMTGMIIKNMDPGQIYANSARTYATESRKFADEAAWKQSDGDRADNQWTTNARNNADSKYKSALSSHDIVKSFLDSQFEPTRKNAENLFNEIKGDLDSAPQRIQEISNMITQPGPIQDVIQSIIDYGHDHDFDWLNDEIRRITGLNDKAITKKETDQGVLDKNTLIKNQYDASLNAYLERMKTEKDKGGAVAQIDIEYANLVAELKQCTDKIEEYQKNIGLTNGKIAILAQEFNTRQTLLTDTQTMKDNKFIEMNNVKNNYNDLSGQLIELIKNRDILKGLISSEEEKYEKLQKDIEKLQVNIIGLTIEDYGNKVFNNQNLLNLNQNIDKDLQNIFTNLKTEIINPDLLYRKTKYRKIEEEKLSNIDKLLDVLFYCFYFAFIIIRIVTRNTKTEDFLIYIFIGLIPYVYPFIYKKSNYITHLFQLDINKNAFIETEPENSIDAYNI